MGARQPLVEDVCALRLLGEAYWVTFIAVGLTPHLLLNVMPVIAAAGFVVMLIAWLMALHQTASLWCKLNWSFFAPFRQIAPRINRLFA